MRKVFCLMIALLLCASLALPVLAVEGEFVPSITYKDGPAVEEATLNDENVEDCIVITTIEEAEDKSTDIKQEERDLLLEVYEKLKDGDMTLPLDYDYAIRDLVDVSFEHDDCRAQEDHSNKDQYLKKPGSILTIDFELNVGKNTDVDVLVYIDGKWQPIEKVTNNGDGTVTCVFEDICPVAFVVKQSYYETSPKTGDMIGQNLSLWIGVLGVSAVALVTVVVISRRKRK